MSLREHILVSSIKKYFDSDQSLVECDVGLRITKIQWKIKKKKEIKHSIKEAAKHVNS